MSYMIVYDRQVLVTPQGYSFIVLHGDNNVYEPARGRNGTERRVRNWNCWLLNKSKEEILEYFKGWCGSKYQEHFRIPGRQEYVDDAALMRWVENGLKSARTVEEFKDYGHTISAHIEYWPADGSWSRRTAEAYIRSDAEFAEWVKTAEAAKEELMEQGVKSIYTILGFSQDEPLKLPHKKQKEVDGPVIVKYGRWYLSDAKGSSSYALSVRFEDAKVFSSYEDAKAATDGIRSRKGVRNILSYQDQAKAQKRKTNIVQFEWPSGRKEYVISRERNGWRTSLDVQRAMRLTKRDANKMLKDTQRLSDKTIVVSIVEVAS